MGSKDQSGLGSAATAGQGSVGSNTSGFTMPDGSDGSTPTSSDPANLAGLTGIQSGATMPNFSNAVAPSGNYQFNMPDKSNWAGTAGNALGTASKTLTSGTGQQGMKGGGGGKLTLPTKSFSAPVSSGNVVPGTQGVGGAGLIQLLQKYRAGTA
jgi:hypothetical protein